MSPRSAVVPEETVPDVAGPAGFSRRATQVLVLVALLGGILLVRSPSEPVEVLEVPEAGDVVARLLPNGTPVWVAAAGDGDVTVVEALTPGSSPIGGIVGWCTAGRRFVDPILGVSFAPDGTRYNGRNPGRLGRADDPQTGLTVRTFVSGGEARPGDPLRIGVAGTPSREVRDPPLGGEQFTGPPLGCRLPTDGDPETGGGLSGLVHHGGLAGGFDSARSGWQIVDAHLRVDPDGRTTLCEAPAVSDEPCTPILGAVVDLGLREEAPGTITTVIGDPIAVRVEQGIINRVAVLPNSLWSGSSLRRTLTTRLLTYGADQSANRLVVDVPEGADDPVCVSTAPPAAQAVGGSRVVYVNLDALVAVGSAVTFDQLGGLDPAAPILVDVVIDRVTCRALAIRDAG